MPFAGNEGPNQTESGSLIRDFVHLQNQGILQNISNNTDWHDQKTQTDLLNDPLDGEYVWCASTQYIHLVIS